ncbi:MAG: SDR family oxidoreductase [Rhodospirillales bacterium]|jgi:nucleoside-diphosphate-sugar epimerase|nr:SDR family oxidoreductase [Rhodospirillales bacterium]MBT4006500.1 SDR family oxidoreductase [Rhodospirillales bacterium]MBT5075906.1 SDR family oxidoreductase [Rhodospirillales bacterium]MBT5113778.1 SDR family oxidoreductase [Rhodospirillales bacterium]MBT5672306.1 SDR family oxidoreductase [Rhodospirillales bacterium]
MITGGAGYVGAVLTPKLLEMGHKVTVLDLYMYGDGVLEGARQYDGLREIHGDIRDPKAIEAAMEGCDTVIHLACISNDPSYDLDPELGKSINYDCFRPMIKAAKAAGVKRFIYASSSSVYGIKEEPNVHEGLELDPLTDYSKFKALCETVLEEEREPGFTTLTLRPATVCGYSPRLRLDLSVNILTNHAINNGKITVFGGEQLRPNIHIQDMTDLYIKAVEADASEIDGKIWNAGYENHSINKIAEIVRHVIGEAVGIEVTPTDDNRSYHVSSEKIKTEFGFSAKHTIEDAVRDIKDAFDKGLVPDSMTDSFYFNIKRMQEIDLH